MSVVSNAGKKRKKSESKPQSQLNKCLNEKRRREQENIYIEELAELISASTSDMSSLSVKPDKCAILQETVNQIRLNKQHKPEQSDDLQQSEVSSSKPTILTNDIYGPLLLEALEGFLFVVNIDGKVEFVSENISSFLKYTQEEIVEKSLYDIIHTNDRPRFSNSLIPMMSIGNGRSWSTEANSNSAGKSKPFNCRFLIKSEEQDINMDNKSTSHNPQFENMQVSAVFFPFSPDVSEVDGVNDQQNRIACVARRIPANEKSPTSLGVEQFTTRMDRTGKVMDIDTSGVSSAYSHYLNKELVGCIILDLCHPSDLNKLKQHLKDTIENGSNTSSIYKLQVANDCYVKIQTKSRKFSNATDHVITSTHSIIRDADSPAPSVLDNNIQSVPSPNMATASSSTGNVSVSTSVNGSISLASLSLPATYGNLSLNPSDNEYVLNDLVLEMFPSSSWSLDQNSTQSKESDNVTVSSFISVNSPQGGGMSSRSSDLQGGMHLTNSAFSPSLVSSRSGSSNPSPSHPGRAPTPYGNSISCFSPSTQAPPGGGKTSPQCAALPAKADSLNVAEVPNVNNFGSKHERAPLLQQQYSLKANQKLRNLLTQNMEDVVTSRTISRQVSQQDEVTIVNESRAVTYDVRQRMVMRESNTNSGMPSVPCSSKDAILRDLLNQDDDSNEPPTEPIGRAMEGQVPNSFVNSVSCKAAEGGQQRVGNNDMLRKLLNNDDGDRAGYRKSQDLIHQLLVNAPSDKNASFQNDRYRLDMTSHSRIADNSVPKQPSINVNRAISDVNHSNHSAETMVLKRKTAERHPVPNSASKRQSVASLHAQLAGQNPMLVSMLERTPETPPSVSTSVANSIMTQLPQERLPKNLEKKLVHTPCTAATGGNTTSTATQAFTPSTSSATQQQDVVTSDARGHVLQQQLNKVTYSQPQQFFLDKLLSGTDENLLIARSVAVGLTSGVGSSNQNAVFVQQLSTQNSNADGTASLADILNDAGILDPDSFSDSIQTTQASDPGFAEILEQIYSLQEDLNVETTPTTREDRGAILKILNDVIDPPPPVNIVSRPPVATNATIPAHDISEKIAISAIQKQLMSFEGSSLSVTSRTGSMQNSSVPTYSQAGGRSSTQVSGTPVAQVQLTPAEIALLQQQQQISTGTLPPNYSSSLVGNRVRFPANTPMYATQNNNSRDLLATAQRRGLQIVRNTYIGLGGANVTQIRKSILERKQRLFLQHEQKRLLEQQQKQQLTMQTQQPLDGISSSGASAFPENMSDLLNNTVAPNVTLQRSSSLPETQTQPHFNTTMASPMPSPSQLSPNQQRHNTQSPFSSLSQQQQFQTQQPSPPSSYQSRLSPHPPPSYPQQGRSSHSPSPVPSPRLVMSPQQQTVPSQQQQQWRTSGQSNSSNNNSLQLQNPMLNAQLSQASLNANQIRLTAQQRQQLAMRTLSSPNTIQHNSRNSSLASQGDGSYSPLSPPVAILHNQPQAQHQQRMQRTISIPGRIVTANQSQSSSVSFGASEPVISPQPTLQSPSFSQSLPTSTVSFVTIPSPGLHTTYSLSQGGGQHFNFDRQNIQVFTSSANDSLRSVNNQASSDFVRQELRAVVGARTHQPITSQNQLHQPMQSASLTTSAATSAASVSRLLNVHSLSRETLEELGLSMELLQGTELQQSPQILYNQALLGANNLECSNQPSASSLRAEEPKPADQKKSLLQQLLSEPT